MAGDTCPFPASRARVSAYLFPVVVKLTPERVEVASGRPGAVIEIQSRLAGGGPRDGRTASAAIDLPIALSRDRCRW